MKNIARTFAIVAALGGAATITSTVSHSRGYSQGYTEGSNEAYDLINSKKAYKETCTAEPKSTACKIAHAGYMFKTINSGMR